MMHQEERFFDPERWAIVPASDYATGPSNGHACHTLREAMRIFHAELPSRMSNAMRRQRELDDLRSFLSGTRSAVVLKQTTVVSAVQNEVATLIGLLREYEQRMLTTIKQKCNDFQAALNERALLVDDTAKKLGSSISRMSTEDAAGNEAVANSLENGQIETILSGMISADHLIEESAALFSNFPDDVTFNVERLKDSMAITARLVTLECTQSQLKGVPPLIITKDITVSGGGIDRIMEGGAGSSSSASSSPKRHGGAGGGGGGGDTGIRRLLQLPGSEHAHGLYPRTAFGQALTKRPFASLLEYHKLLHAGCLRSLGSQLGSVAVNRSEYINPISDTPLRSGRDTYKVFSVCTAATADGNTRNLAQNLLHLPKEAAAAAASGAAGGGSSNIDVVKLTPFRTVNQNFGILWFDFGPSASIRVERYVLFHGHELQHCAMRNWRLLGTNDLPFPPGIVAVAEDDTLLKIARDARNSVNERHKKAETPDAALPDNSSVAVLDLRAKEPALGASPFGGVMFECCGENNGSNNNNNKSEAIVSPNRGGASSSAVSVSLTTPPVSPRSIAGSPASRHQRDFFRFVGIQVTAPGAAGGFHIELAGVEFFGTMMTMGGQ